MANLVPIPWQPGYYLTPDTLAYLVAAGAKLGTQLTVVDAWRSYAEQAYYYDQYLHHGGPPASNPDTGQRNHMRGAAFDLARTDAAVQAACRSVGLIRDAAETWHWNNPNWANMPIIPTNTTTTGGGGAIPIPIEVDMPLTPADINLLLNSRAWTGGPSISQALKNTDAVFNAIFAGGGSMKDGGKSVSQSLAELNRKASGLTPEQARQLLQIFNAVFNGGLSMKDDGKSLSQSVAEIHTEVKKP